ncbi:MAG: preprotein translocase subunit Sec61beta [Candidatus Woesearchaeota archaeon]
MADKIRLPSSMGGLVSYTEEYKSKLHFKPAYVIILAIIIILIVILLHIYGGTILGL